MVRQSTGGEVEMVTKMLLISTLLDATVQIRSLDEARRREKDSKEKTSRKKDAQLSRALFDCAREERAYKIT
jgi:hypothetical protein